ncbi:MAG TPA: YkgJ family cysteine cluster protein [Polyangiaceae bacterium]
MEGDSAHPVRLRTAFTLTRSAPFSYQCRACSRCCRGKIIPLNPYEVARLARVLGATTTEVLTRFTGNGGSTLAVRDDHSCIFLGENGCTVHGGRPLACRLYPLGRQVAPDGEERFAEVEPHPQSAGVYGGAGTVDDYLRSQDVEPYHRAAARYATLFRRMLAVLACRKDLGDVREASNEAMNRAPGPDDDSLVDVDAVVTRHCAERGIPVPDDLEKRVELHLEALEALLERMECEPR